MSQFQSMVSSAGLRQSLRYSQGLTLHPRVLGSAVQKANHCRTGCDHGVHFAAATSHSGFTFWSTAAELLGAEFNPPTKLATTLCVPAPSVETTSVA